MQGVEGLQPQCTCPSLLRRRWCGLIVRLAWVFMVIRYVRWIHTSVVIILICCCELCDKCGIIFMFKCTPFRVPLPFEIPFLYIRVFVDDFGKVVLLLAIVWRFPVLDDCSIIWEWIMRSSMQLLITRWCFII
jgi:hypothetical protein